MYKKEQLNDFLDKIEGAGLEAAVWNVYYSHTFDSTPLGPIIDELHYIIREVSDDIINLERVVDMYDEHGIVYAMRCGLSFIPKEDFKSKLNRLETSLVKLQTELDNTLGDYGIGKINLNDYDYL